LSRSGLVPPLTSSPPLLSRLYLSVLCNKIIKEDSALHCGRQRSPQTLETRIDAPARWPVGSPRPERLPMPRGRYSIRSVSNDGARWGGLRRVL
ncbi:unnamed protein product, partial [Ascophyllum nodosum]